MSNKRWVGAEYNSENLEYPVITVFGSEDSAYNWVSKIPEQITGIAEHPRERQIAFMEYDPSNPRPNEYVLAKILFRRGVELVKTAGEIPTHIHFWYMYDNHSFAKLKGKTLDDIIDQAKEISTEAMGRYGMLCNATLMSGDKEIDRVGICVHASPTLNEPHIEEKLDQWKIILRADSDIRRLMKC